MIQETTKYVISLPERSDRRQAFDLSATRAGISDYIYFSAIKSVGKKQAQAACRESHKRIIELARDTNLPQVIIIEDDAVFSPSILSKLEGIPSDWELLYFGANNYKPLQMISSTIGRCTYSLSTVCYAVRNTIYNLITSLLDQDLPLDMILATQVQPVVKAYCFKPNLVSQAPGFSDIERKFKNYSQYYDKD